MAKIQTDHRYTLEEYMALEKVSERRYEYRDGEIVCMSGGTLNHYRIEANLFGLLRENLKGSGCRPFTADAAIKSPASPYYRYPDTSVVCGEIIIEKVLGIDAITNPIAIFEVLTLETEEYDKNDKRKIYQAISTLRDYLVVAQDSAHIIRYTKQGDIWHRNEAADLSASIELPSLNIVLPFADIYDGVTFE